MTTQPLPHDGEQAGSLRLLTAERILLMLGGMFMLVNVLSLALLRPAFRPVDWLPFVVWGGCAALGSHLLARCVPRRDALLFPLAMFLTAWGLVIIERVAPAFTNRQALWLASSVAAMLAVALVPQVVRWLRAYRYLLLSGGFTLLVGAIFLGTNPSGLTGAPQLWLDVGSLYVQPSELLKIVLVVFLASYLAEQYPLMRAPEFSTGRFAALSPRIVGPVLLMWGLSMVILIWQRDLGTAMLFFVVFSILLYIASGFTFILLGGAVLISIGSFVAYHLYSVVQLRIDVWLHPWEEASGRAYQSVQSLMAFASGSVFGQGIGQGSPTNIPVVHSDFIFAALAEEWGLLGVIALVVVVIALVVRGLRIAIRQQGRPFPALMAIGLSMLLGVQSLLIMGGVLKLLPLTGVTLPFLSYGGSSLLVSFIAVGLLLRLSAGEG